MVRRTTRRAEPSLASVLILFLLGGVEALGQQQPVCNTVTLAGELVHTIDLAHPATFANARTADLNNDGLDDILLFGSFDNTLASLVNRGNGERVAAFRGSARHKKMVTDLRRAQAEADIICF